MEYDKRRRYSPLELMELAYEESLNSFSEHDDRPDPMVGAILATSEGRILATAHRGELRIGEHCEYTLIERKLRSEDLSGCHLFVTLEPCVDHVRNSPKRGCATHIINARISKVFVGMRNPDIDIENEGVNELLRNRVKVEDFPSEINDRIRESLKAFIAFKEAEKLVKKKERKKVPKPFLKQAASNTKISQFSALAVNRFIEHAGADLKFPSVKFTEWALGFGLATHTGNTIVPTKFGLLIFGNKVDELFPHCIFKVELDYGTGDPEIWDFGGPLSNQLERVLDFIKDKALRLTIDRTDARRSTRSEFPFEVLREVVANAIIHRDYSIEQATNYIYISADRIVVRSPGLPVAPLTIEDIRTMDLPSISRNPKIMYIYNRMGMAEQRGIGLRSLKQLSKYALPLPQFSLKGNVMEIVFGREQGHTVQNVKDDTSSISAQDRESLFFVQQNEPISVGQYAAHFDLTDKTAQRRLADLVSNGHILKEGDRRWTRYRIDGSKGKDVL